MQRETREKHILCLIIPFYQQSIFLLGFGNFLLLTSLARRSYSSINRSLSWLTLRTLQILLAAISACKQKTSCQKHSFSEQNWLRHIAFKIHQKKTEKKLKRESMKRV